MTAVLEVRRVSKRFQGFEAVRDVTFDVADGEIRGLIGPNGAGKSTLLHLIFGREFPDSGTVSFRGHDLGRTPSHKRARLGMGLKLQLTSTFPLLTVEQNLRLGALARSHSDQDHRDLEEVLEFAYLKDVRSVPAGQLSHGGAKWLEIGMVLLSKPSLLLLDEPTAGMDPSETRRTAELLRSLIDRAVVDAILIVEHDMEFIRDVSDRLVVLHHAQLLADGSVAEVRANQTVQEVYLGRAP